MTSAALSSVSAHKKPLMLISVILVVLMNGLYATDLWSMVDLAVYRRGGLDILSGVSLYQPVHGLPFTYPPFAAVLFAPLALIPAAAAIVLMTVVSVTSYAIFVVVCARGLLLSWYAAMLLGILGIAYEPVLHTIGIGQINLLLASLVATDCLALNGRYSGWLIGLTIGIKLTPGIFLLYFAMRRDWASIGRAVLSFMATVIVAWIISPADSRRFWGQLFYDPGHVGRITYPFNQSMYGGLARLGHTLHPSLLVYGALSTAVLSLTAVAVLRQLRTDHNVAALVSVAVGGLLISPVSWTHHWVWLVPASWVLMRNRQWIGAAFVAGVPLGEPLRYVPTPKHLPALHQDWWQASLSLAYTAAGLWFLAAMLGNKSLAQLRVQTLLAQPKHEGRIGRFTAQGISTAVERPAR